VNPLSGVFGEAWKLYKGHWRHFFSIAIVVFLVVAVASMLLIALLGWVGAILAGLVSLIATFWVQGALIEAVSDVRDGRADLSVSDTYSRVRPKLGTIVVAGLLLGFAIGIGLVLFIVPGVILMTIWIAVIPAIVLENRGIGESFGRSWELVKGRFWYVLLTIVLTILLWFGISVVISIALAPLADWLAGLIQQIVGNTIVIPFVVTVWTLAYYRLKGREEMAAAAPEPEPAA
jgi:Membrane domain of glycerophosphoryl diester phosphodiesterase